MSVICIDKKDGSRHHAMEQEHDNLCQLEPVNDEVLKVV